MSYQVRIEQFDTTIEVEPDETILESALFAGLDYPFACQQGQCGSCKSFLIAGQVDMGTTYNPLACTIDERARGLILACQSRPLCDCTVSVVELGGAIVHSVRDLLCSVVEIERIGEAIRVLRLRVDTGGPFNFVAGQYALATFDGLPERAYAIASIPTDELIELHIHCLPDGVVSRYVRSAIAPGAVVRLRGPFGEVYLHDEHLGPIVAIAEGAGIAPMLSIVRSACALGLPQRIRLIARMSAEAAAYYAALLDALKREHRNFDFELLPLAHAAPSIEAVITERAPLHGARVYMAGHASMIEGMERFLVAQGVDGDSIGSISVEPSQAELS